MTRPTNFLFFITDQHRADHLGCYGNPVVRTPNIDALAANGFVADECHVATPICMPNRASLMTGRMPSRHGVRHNGIELSLDERTLPEQLREAGYRTIHVGKSHLQNIDVRPPGYPREGEPKLGTEARREGPGRHGQEEWKRWEDDPDATIETPFYGFDSVDLCIYHADDQFGHWRRWLRSQVPNADALTGPENALPAPDYALTRCRQAWRTRVPEALYPTSWVADRAIDRLREARADGRPFFLHCSFPDPHHPFTPPGKYWDMYAPDDVATPASFHGTHRNLPPHVQWMFDRRADGTAVKTAQTQFACTEREAKEAIALNYGSITFIDAAIGRVLAELDALGMKDDTVVVFTSDHGDYLGDHQLLLKGPIHYRGITRVPFVWHDPQRLRGMRSSALLQTIDLAPTILDRAGVPAWNGIQGRSVLPLVDGAAATLRDTLLIEEEGQRYFLGFRDRVRMRSVLDGRHRLSVYDGVEWGELYDLGEDPHELHNLWPEPAARPLRAEMMEKLARAMLSAAETSPYPTRIA